jgi:hypothetical protein
MSGPRTLEELNSEAGRHAFPTDPAVVEAALRAARRCWDAYPYYAARYGERGLRFAHSDVGWLATLIDGDDATVVDQIEWLAKVLACRGMPSVLLERQLGMLQRGLAASAPARDDGYAGILRGEAHLRAARARILDEGTFAARAAAFDAAAGRGPEAIVGCGEIIVGAVVDERGGRRGALGSVEPWLTDAARFPAAWVAAVAETIAAAHAAAR